MHMNPRTNLIRTYLDERVTDGHLATSSAEVTSYVLHQWARHAGADPKAWTPELAAEWVNDPRLRPSTRKSRLHKLRPFVRWAVDAGVMPRDITRRIARIHVPEGPARDLRHSDVVRLLAVCPDARATLIILLMVHAGLRCGDVARIRIEDIDVNGRQLHVRGKGGRGEYTHWAPIGLEAWHCLVSWIRTEKRHTGPLVCSYQRPGHALRPDTIGDLVAEWIAAAGLKAFPYDGRTPHCLRHTCATHIVVGDETTDGDAPLVDIRGAQRLLGHARQATTEGYVRRTPEGLREAVDRRRYLPTGKAA